MAEGPIGIEAAKAEHGATRLSGLDFVIRHWLPADRPFIADSWAKTVRGSTREKRKIQESSFFAHVNKEIDAVLNDSRTTVSVASPPADDFMVYGYAVRTPPSILHMVFVKLPFRKRGIATKLLAGVEVGSQVFTQWSVDLADWILPKLSRVVGRNKWGQERYESDVIYNPYWLDQENQ